MARELADVLHHFLGEAPPALRGPACLTVVSEPDDAFAASATWNLAHALLRRGLPVALVSSLDDEELLPAEPTPGPARLLAPARDADGLVRAVAEAGAKLDAGGAPGVVLLRLPPGWIGRAAAPLLGATLQLVAPDLERRARALEHARSIFAAQPAARLGVTLCDVRSVEEAERAYTALARACAERSQARLTSYGVLLDDADLYRSLLARRPLPLLRPAARAARALADVARLLSEDLAADAR
jgi:hypothetical protein